MEINIPWLKRRNGTFYGNAMLKCVALPIKLFLLYPMKRYCMRYLDENKYYMHVLTLFEILSTDKSLFFMTNLHTCSIVYVLRTKYSRHDTSVIYRNF